MKGDLNYTKEGFVELGKLIHWASKYTGNALISTLSATAQKVLYSNKVRNVLNKTTKSLWGAYTYTKQSFQALWGAARDVAIKIDNNVVNLNMDDVNTLLKDKRTYVLAGSLLTYFFMPHIYSAYSAANQ